ncbi:MAG: alpha/beta hydrolase [Chloroflexota bacterium]|nr:alpha/beta hydrolase [Chloroflexota bacterium]
MAVLIHGITSNAGSWARVAPELNGLGYRCIAPELRGHGESPKPDEGYAAADLVRDLVETLPPEPDLLIGHSLGGFLALNAAARGVLSPARLVLEDPLLVGTPSSTRAVWESFQESRSWGEADLQAANPLWSAIDVREKWLALQQAHPDGVRQILAGPLDAGRLFARLTMPTLVLRAGSSELVSEELVADLERALGAGSVVTLSGAGHSVHRDDLPGFMRAIRPFVR